MKQEKNISKKQWCITLLMIMFMMLTCLGGLFLQRTPTAAEVMSDTNFVDDQVIVTLTKRETRKFLDYSADDFQEIGAASVEDLTASTVEWVEKQVRGIPTEEEMLVNVENFRRVLCITLATSGRSEVLEAVSRLEQKNGIESASPNYIYEEVLARAGNGGKYCAVRIVYIRGVRTVLSAFGGDVPGVRRTISESRIGEGAHHGGAARRTCGALRQFL